LTTTLPPPGTLAPFRQKTPTPRNRRGPRRRPIFSLRRRLMFSLRLLAD